MINVEQIFDELKELSKLKTSLQKYKNRVKCLESNIIQTNN